MPPESLDLLQRRFWRLITAPDGVSAGLSDVASYDPGVAPVTSWIAAEDEETARERLDVYANMYFFRILDAVKSDVPRVAQLLGDDAFHDLTVDYLLAHPSTNASLRHAAAQLPAFLAGHNLAVGRPDLPDLARLELARNDVFHGPDSATLEAHTLSTISPEAWPQLRFRLVPTVRWLRLHTTTVPTWRALADGAPPPGPAPSSRGAWSGGRAHPEQRTRSGTAPLRSPKWRPSTRSRPARGSMASARSSRRIYPRPSPMPDTPPSRRW